MVGRRLFGGIERYLKTLVARGESLFIPTTQQQPSRRSAEIR